MNQSQENQLLESIIYGPLVQAAESSRLLFGPNEVHYGLLYRDFTRNKFKALISDFLPLTRRMMGPGEIWDQIVNSYIEQFAHRGKGDIFGILEGFPEQLASECLSDFAKYELGLKCLLGKIKVDQRKLNLHIVLSNYNLPSLFTWASRQGMDGHKSSNDPFLTSLHQEGIGSDAGDEANAIILKTDQFRMQAPSLFVGFEKRDGTIKTIRLQETEYESLVKWSLANSDDPVGWGSFFDRLEANV